MHTHLRFCQQHLLDAVVVLVDVVKLGSKHPNARIVFEVPYGSLVQVLHLLPQWDASAP